PPAVIAAAAQGSAPGQQTMTSFYPDSGHPDGMAGLPSMGVVAEALWRQSGLAPRDVQTAVLYDHFTPFVLMQLEELGFCGRGGGGGAAAAARPGTSPPTAGWRSAGGCRSTRTAASSARPTSTA